MRLDDLPREPVPGPTYRLVPSRYPPINAFEDVAHVDDLDAVMALEGWTNDRLVRHRLNRLPRAEWVFGRPNASVVMAAFLHAAPDGQRFSAGALGAWYASLHVRTAIAEVAHHLRRELANTGLGELQSVYRTYTASLAGAYLDIRAKDLPSLYASDDYTAGQAFGERVRAAGENGILYDSLRHRGGTNVVAYRPTKMLDVTQSAHYDVTVRAAGPIVVRDVTPQT
jgi:hypothetical protein